MVLQQDANVCTIGFKASIWNKRFQQFHFCCKMQKTFILSSKYQVENLTEIAHLLG